MKPLLLLLMISSLGFSQEVLLSEKFENGLPDTWTVESDNNRKWIHKTFRDLSYMHMSAYGGKGKPGYEVKTQLHTPLLQIDDETCKLKFSFADAYMKGQPLSVVLSNERKQMMKKLDAKNWENLVNNKGSYDNKMETTPWIPLPNLNQAYHISFVYNSKPEEGQKKIVTTLIQLNEVDVWCE